MDTVEVVLVGLDPEYHRVAYRMDGTKDGRATTHAFSILYGENSTGIADDYRPAE